jgi:hypothetical protein
MGFSGYGLKKSTICASCGQFLVRVTGLSLDYATRPLAGKRIHLCSTEYGERRDLPN